MKIKSLLNRKVQVELGSAVLILVVLGAISYRAMVVASESTRWVRHTHEVLENLQDLRFAIESIESSYRGFALTGKESYLASYRADILSVRHDEAAIRDLTVDNPAQQRRLPALRSLVTQKIQFAEMIIALRRDKGFAAASESVGQDEGLHLMNEILDLTTVMGAEERDLLLSRTVLSQASAAKARLVVRIGWLLAIGFLIAASGVVYRDFAELTRAEEKLRRFAAIVESSDDAILSKNLEGIIQSWNGGAERLYGYSTLEAVGQHMGVLAPSGGRDDILDILTRIAKGERVEHYETRRRRKDGLQIDVSLTLSPVKDSTGKVVGASTIARDITDQKRSEAEIKELHGTLGDRMAELEATNQELEAFSYSVSHDLRAPLRHLSGFSKILLEEYGPRLDQTAQHYLQRISAATLKMGQLVDDLLNLSRLGRREISRQPAALNSVLKQVLADRQPEIEGRNIEWRIGQLSMAECDPALVTLVFDNLLSNALKFTRPRQPAVIEVGQTTLAGETVVYVRDNGVGFNMKHAGKLFGVFQRLHRAEDFEGTGVGLATVQRIIQKHGGRIWAEAELEKGCTFYFTLSPALSIKEQALTAAA